MADGAPVTFPPVLEAPELARLDGVRHGFFTREGGVSDGIYSSLNCGYGSNDDRAKVAANRAAAAAAIDARPEALVTAYQVHGIDVAVVTSPWTHGNAPKADAMATARPGIMLGVLTADCAPVLLADGEAGVIGACHAGWRGALAGVTEATVAAMERLGARRDRIIAAVGPCIGRASYEVGPEFPQPFLDQAAANQRFFAPAARAGHWMFDLAGYVAAGLAAAGLAAVGCSELDSCADADRLFSYRRATLRGEPDFGRGLSAIMIEE